MRPALVSPRIRTPQFISQQNHPLTFHNRPVSCWNDPNMLIISISRLREAEVDPSNHYSSKSILGRTDDISESSGTLPNIQFCFLAAGYFGKRVSGTPSGAVDGRSNMADDFHLDACFAKAKPPFLLFVCVRRGTTR